MHPVRWRLNFVTLLRHAKKSTVSTRHTAIGTIQSSADEHFLLLKRVRSLEVLSEGSNTSLLPFQWWTMAVTFEVIALCVFRMNCGQCEVKDRLASNDALAIRI